MVARRGLITPAPQAQTHRFSPERATSITSFRHHTAAVAQGRWRSEHSQEPSRPLHCCWIDMASSLTQSLLGARTSAGTGCHDGRVAAVLLGHWSSGGRYCGAAIRWRGTAPQRQMLHAASVPACQRCQSVRHQCGLACCDGWRIGGHVAGRAAARWPAKLGLLAASLFRAGSSAAIARRGDYW
jgi:hypothetical protein